MPFFESIALIPEDSILGLMKAFIADPNPNKVNLSIGAYKTADNKPLLLTCISKAETLLAKEHLFNEYLPIEGNAHFLKLVLPLAFGKESPLLSSGSIFAAQTIGGSGALRIGAEFLAKSINPVIYLSDPSWANHKPIFEKAGLIVHSYPYYDPRNNTLKFDAFCAAIKKMPSGSIILLQGCCHNPTGLNLSFEQWKEISSLIKKQKILPFFDMPYQGFGESLEADVRPLRYFVDQGHEMFVAYTFSKNFSLYGERIGFLAAVTRDVGDAQRVGSHIKHLIRVSYSNPPLHGARLISTVLGSPELTLEWTEELKNMQVRIVETKRALLASLMTKVEHKDFSYMHNQSGMFTFCGLDHHMVNHLRKEKSLYIPSNGRINIAAINTQNLEYITEALASVL
jgi:aspartate/tyrosine/aromatic aminotransferase